MYENWMNHLLYQKWLDFLLIFGYLDSNEYMIIFAVPLLLFV